MKKRRKDKQKSCGSKMSYPTKQKAMGAIYYTLKKHFIFHRMRPYKCRYCKKWHIGKTNIIMYDKFEELIK